MELTEDNSIPKYKWELKRTCFDNRLEAIVWACFRPVVKVDNRWTERKLLEDVVNGSTDGLRASVPDRLRSAPSERPTPMRENTV